MNVLTALSITLLGLLIIWFVWPLIADPIARRRAERAGRRDTRRDDFFRSLADNTGPKGHLVRVERG